MRPLFRPPIALVTILLLTAIASAPALAADGRTVIVPRSERRLTPGQAVFWWTLRLAASRKIGVAHSEHMMEATQTYFRQMKRRDAAAFNEACGVLTEVCETFRAPDGKAFSRVLLAAAGEDSHLPWETVIAGHLAHWGITELPNPLVWGVAGMLAAIVTEIEKRPLAVQSNRRTTKLP